MNADDNPAKQEGSIGRRERDLECSLLNVGIMTR